jgi:membrane protein implicated in regulation of membrane protease activity
MARRAAAKLALFICLATAAFAVARSQMLQRLSVQSFDLSADAATPRVGVPFHLVVTLRVRERVAEIENLNLPILAQLELLGDERETSSGPRGTLYRETITVVAHDPGSMGIAPATLQAIDARDGKAKEWYSNGLALSVAGTGSQMLRNGGQTALAGALAALAFVTWLFAWVLGIGFVAACVLVIVRRRTRAAPIAASPAPEEPLQRSQRDQAGDALTVLRAQRTRGAAVAVRAAIWRMAGAADGETLGDVLRRPDVRDATLRRLLVALERAAFTYDDDLAAAIDDACVELENYVGGRA